MSNNTHNILTKTCDEAVDYLLLYLPSVLKDLSDKLDPTGFMNFVRYYLINTNTTFGLWHGNNELIENGDSNFKKPELALTTIIIKLSKRLQKHWEVYEKKDFSNICNLIIPDFEKINLELIEYFASHPNELYNKLSPRQFEKLIEAVFRNQGYRTELGPGYNDGGIDLRIFYKDAIGEISTLVQAKLYNPENPIRIDAVKAFAKTVDDEKANRGLFVATSRYLPGVKKFAEREGHMLTLATSKDVSKWCQQVRDKYWKDNSNILGPFES